MNRAMARRRRWLSALLFFCLTAVAGGLVAVKPVILLLLGLGAMVAVLIARPAGRLVLVIGGGMLVLQSSAGLNGPKVGYFIVLIACIAFAAARAPAVLRCEWGESFRPVVVASAWLGLYLCISSVVAVVHGTALTLWLRDVIGYALVAAVPVLALDFGSHMRPASTVRWTAAFGVIAPIGYASYWLERRGATSLPIGQFMLASFALCIVPFAYALVRSLNGKRRGKWALLAAFIPIAMIIAGSRSAIVLLVGLFGIAGSRYKGRVSPRRVLGAVTTGAILWLAILPSLARLTSGSDQFLNTRAAQAVSFLHGGRDASAENRISEYRLANRMFADNRLFGTGPGAIYYLDTPLATVAKLGIVGMFLLAGYFWTLLVAFRRVRTRRGWSDVQTAGRVVLVVIIAYVPLAPFIEDKGFSFGLLLLVLMLVAEARSCEECQPTDWRNTSSAYPRPSGWLGTSDGGRASAALSSEANASGGRPCSEVNSSPR